MKLFLAVVCLSLALAAASNGDAEREFELFQKKFGKVYKDEGEKAKRFGIFKDNLERIRIINQSTATWKEGVTKFADLTQDEFQSTLNGYVNMKQPGAAFGAKDAPAKSGIDVSQLPEYVNWAETEFMTPVKDQGSCGSCWAFAGTQSIESYAALNSGELLELSAQQMTSCTPNELECGGTGGCSGSIPQLGFTYTQLFGITGAADIPYISGFTGSTGDCTFDPVATPARAYVMGFEVLERNDQDLVLNHLANVGPLSVAVDASVWGLYESGVFDNCPTDSNIGLNHAVQLTGYGTDEETGLNYWIVRNSWGESWGEAGYIRLLRHDEAFCGTDSTPLMGTACINDGQDSQYVCGTCGVLFDVSYPIGAYVVQEE